MMRYFATYFDDDLLLHREVERGSLAYTTAMISALELVDSDVDIIDILVPLSIFRFIETM